MSQANTSQDVPTINPTPTSKPSAWKSPAFLLVAAILGIAAVAQIAAVSQLQMYFQKAPIAPAAPLDSIAQSFGDWVQVSRDEPLDKELEDSLATKLFVFRDFVNRKVLTKDELADFDNKTAKERKVSLNVLQSRKPAAVMNMAVTYYTGGADTVAHIPDRCYIADGFAPSEYIEPFWNCGPGRLGKGPKDDPRIQVRLINFEDQTGVGRVTRRVAYFFHANGHYESDPIAVRTRLQNLFERYGYYAKVELMMQNVDNDTCQRVMSDFLTGALPEVEKCLPDWKKVGVVAAKPG